MGNSKTKDYSKDTFFNSTQLKLLSGHFNLLFNKGTIDHTISQKLFEVPNDPEIHPSIENYLSSQVKTKKDFEGFLKALEILIFGKNKTGGISYDIKGPIERFSNILSITEETQNFNEVLLRHLLAIIQGDFSIISSVNPHSQSIRDFQAYFQIQYPVLANCFPNFLISRLLDKPPSLPPSLNENTHNINEALSFLYLSCPALCGIELVRLFLSKEDGLSFNRLAAGLNGYQGPMILTIKLSDSTLLGAFIGDGLRDNAKYSGSMDTFLFTFYNGYHTFRPEEGEGGGNFIYFNSRIAGTSKFPKGLGFGGNIPQTARIWLDDDIDMNSYAISHCSTYPPGDFFNAETDGKMHIVSIEVWGCGGEKAAKAQQEYRDSEAQRIQKNRQVDKAQFLDSQFDKDMLLGGTFKNAEYREKAEAE